MAEIVTAERWLHQVLGGDAALMALVTGVHSYPIPTTAQLPFVLVSDQSGADLLTAGAHRFWLDGLWVVRAVFETSKWAGDLEAAADRIDALLHGKAGAVTGGNVWACVRVQPFRLTEEHAGQQLRHLGGIYRLQVK